MIRHHKTEENARFVAAATRQGMKQEYIAQKLRISVDTLAAHYDYEIHHHFAELEAEVEDLLLVKVRAGNLDAIKFWLTHRAKWWAAKAPLDILQQGEVALVKYVKDNVKNDIDKLNSK